MQYISAFVHLKKNEARATQVAEQALVLYQSNRMFLWMFWSYIDTIALKCPHKSWKPGCRIWKVVAWVKAKRRRAV